MIIDLLDLLQNAEHNVGVPPVDTVSAGHAKWHVSTHATAPDITQKCADTIQCRSMVHDGSKPKTLV